MLGIELVKDRATKEPAKAECAQVVETCRELGLLLGKGGLWGQTHPVLAADVHHAGRRGFPARSVRCGVFPGVTAAAALHPCPQFW